MTARKIEMVRHPFRVVSMTPQISFWGESYSRPTGAFFVQLESPEGGKVGKAEVVVSQEIAKQIDVGQIVALEFHFSPVGSLFEAKWSDG